MNHSTVMAMNSESLELDNVLVFLEMALLIRDCPQTPHTDLNVHSFSAAQALPLPAHVDEHESPKKIRGKGAKARGCTEVCSLGLNPIIPFISISAPLSPQV